MVDQGIVNTIIAIVGGLIGWILKVIWDSVVSLKHADEELVDKVNKIEVLVAGEYVKRNELQGALNRLFVKLDSIEHKLDKKADK